MKKIKYIQYRTQFIILFCGKIFECILLVSFSKSLKIQKRQIFIRFAFLSITKPVRFKKLAKIDIPSLFFRKIKIVSRHQVFEIPIAFSFL